MTVSGPDPTQPAGEEDPATGPPPPGAPPAPESAYPSAFPSTVAPGTTQPLPQYSAPQRQWQAHRPGAIPLRPLGLGDLYDGAFRIIRKNPGATVGASVIVTSIAMVFPLALAALATVLYGDISIVEPVALDPDRPASEEALTEALAGQVIANGGAVVGALVQAIGLMLVTGMIVHVVAKAVLGQQLTLSQAWAATAGRRWRLIALSLGLMIFFVVLTAAYAGAVIGVWFATEDPVAVGLALIPLPFLVALICWLWIRIYYLAVPPLMLEKTTLMGAIRRNYALTRGQFWRTFGIGFLTSFLASIAGSMVTFPLSLITGLLLVGTNGDVGLLLFTLLQSVTTIVSAAIVTPFVSTVTSLQYVDLRMRKEALDVQLMAAASGPGSR